MISRWRTKLTISTSDFLQCVDLGVDVSEVRFVGGPVVFRIRDGPRFVSASLHLAGFPPAAVSAAGDSSCVSPPPPAVPTPMV